MSSFKKRNPMAKQLGTKLYTSRVVPDKKKDKLDKQARKEMNDAKTKQD
jgi:hypothetical protein